MPQALQGSRYTGSLTCPSCGRKVTGHWADSPDAAPQRCRSCGHVFDAAWPGFHFEPETVVAPRSGGDDDTP
jgi:DNA-directed RNA polymerase subunit N (RpoN/RPB10)